MRALIYSDLQATDGHEQCFGNPNESLQLFRVRTFYTQLLELFTQEQCDCLWDLGDTTDDRSAIPLPAIDVVLAGIAPFPDSDWNIKLIGNHEQYLRNTTLHVGRLFERKFTVIHETEIFEIDDNTLLVCAAYPASDAALAAWLSKTAYDYRGYARRILLGHCQIKGAKLSESVATSGIPTESIGGFSLSLLGHIHKPQHLTVPPPSRAYYVGSPFQQNFGERTEAKRVGVLDTETLDIEWHTLEGFPQYLVLPFEQWAQVVQPNEEHRYQVLLREPKEAEAFYKHSLMTRATPVYDYALDQEASEEVGKEQAWTQDEIMRRWVKRNPPAASGLNATEEELLEYGNLLASS